MARTAVAAALACAALAVSAPPASAATRVDAVLLNVSGMYTLPALGLRSLKLTGTATVVAGTTTGTSSCALSGVVVSSGFPAEAGPLRGACGSVPLACVWSRVALAIDMTCVVEPVGSGTLTVSGAWRPWNINPTTGFDALLAGTLVER